MPTITLSFPSSLLFNSPLTSYFLPNTNNKTTNTTTTTTTGGQATSPTSTLAPSSPPTPTLPPPITMDAVELRRVFNMFDQNGDGRISMGELTKSLRNMGIIIPDTDLSQMIGSIDINGDGCVDGNEFQALYRLIMARESGDQDEEDDIKEAFNVFDKNGDGYISVDELRSVLDSLGLNQGKNLEDCKHMIMKVDVDGDGRVNFKEFKKMMKEGGFASLN